MQLFKENDELEQKMAEVIGTVADSYTLQKQLLFAGCYDCAALGDALFESDRAPLTNAIIQTIFRDSFNQIFQSFAVAGTFESYILVFKKIFGDDVVIEFSVPNPGELHINIEATGLEISNFVERLVENNAYVYNEVMTQDGYNIAFRTIKGFQTQYELDLMLHEMVPAGVYTVISLTVG